MQNTTMMFRVAFAAGSVSYSSLSLSGAQTPSAGGKDPQFFRQMVEMLTYL